MEVLTPPPLKTPTTRDRWPSRARSSRRSEWRVASPQKSDSWPLAAGCHREKHGRHSMIMQSSCVLTRAVSFFFVACFATSSLWSRWSSLLNPGCRVIIVFSCAWRCSSASDLKHQEDRFSLRAMTRPQRMVRSRKLALRVLRNMSMEFLVGCLIAVTSRVCMRFFDPERNQGDGVGRRLRHSSLRTTAFGDNGISLFGEEEKGSDEIERGYRLCIRT